LKIFVETKTEKYAVYSGNFKILFRSIYFKSPWFI